jgi:hypothetical protein
MAARLFSLYNVPDDEAEEVRELLASHEIGFYETLPGNWGVSMPAIWLRDEGQLQEARALIDEYQKKRLVRVREEYALMQRAGTNRTILDVIRENPLRFVVYLAAIAMVIYFSTRPFMDIGK